MGDTGVCTAARLVKYADVVGISVKPGLLSGQQLGWRLTRPTDWADVAWVPHKKFRGLDRARMVHGALTGLDTGARRVFVRKADGTESSEDYDVLVIATGVTSGFWRRPTLQSEAEIDADVLGTHERIAAAGSVIVVGGGATAVGAAASIATTWPEKRVDLFHPGETALKNFHPRSWVHVRQQLIDAGVHLHPGHRAEMPGRFPVDGIMSDPVRWSTGQSPAVADAVIWAVGNVKPNTDWLPASLLDEEGFVRVTPELCVPGHPGIFAIGDVAATDPLRTSARNFAFTVLAHNIRAELAGRRRLRRYRPPKRHWGSIVGQQDNGLEILDWKGRAFRVPARMNDCVFLPLIKKVVYSGIRQGRFESLNSSAVGTRKAELP